MLCLFIAFLYVGDEAEEEADREFHLGPSEPEIDEDAYYNRDPKKALNHYFEEEGCNTT